MDELKKENIEEIYPLSNLQEGIFFHYKLDTAQRQYFEQTSIRIKGALNLDAFEKAFNELVQRHEVLRTVFVHKAPHPPLQVVLRKRKFHFVQQDLRGNENAQTILEQFKIEDKNKVFDLTRDILIRAAVFQLEEAEFEIIWSHHHIILDGWCMGILNQEFFQLYDASCRNSITHMARPQPFKNYIDWLQKQNVKEALAHWRKYLEGYDSSIRLPERGEASKESPYAGRSYYQYLSEYTTQALNNICAKNKVTLSTMMQVAWAIVLGKYNFTEDVVFGIVVSGRPPELPGVESMVGLFINTVPLRITFEGANSFIELVKRTQDEHQANLNYHYCQLADVQNENSLKRQLINHLFTFQNYPRSPFKNPELTNKTESLEVDRLDIFEQTTYNFNIRIIPGQRLALNVEYNENVFDPLLITQVIDHYRIVLEQVVRDERLLIRSIELCKASLPVPVHVLEGVSKPVSLFSKGIFSNANLPSDAVAIRTATETITYDALNKQIINLASFINQTNTSEPVAIVLPRSKDAVLSMLACMKSGTPYMVLEPSLPEARLKEIIEDAGSTLVISAKSFLQKVNSIFCSVPKLNGCLCLDSSTPLYEVNGTASMTKELWNYVGESSSDSIALGGWVSSYTGELFSEAEMDEYSNNALEKLRPFLNKNSNVLEIGCSSGLTMFKIAPHVGRYRGIDISNDILEKTSQEVQRRGFSNILLNSLPADGIDGLEDEFDIIILNSVVQNFETLGYFMVVLKKAINKLSGTGIIFLGDIQDMSLKDDLINDLHLFKLHHPEAAKKVKTDWSNELFLSKTFIDDLVHEFPVIGNIVHSAKIGTISNELTKFRFDSIINVDKNRRSGSANQGMRKKHWYGLADVHETAQPFAPPVIDPSGTAYIIYTSGTTGKAKGVKVSYLSLANYISWANEYYFEDQEGNMPLITSLSVDLTITSILCPLTLGRTLFIFEPESHNTLLLQSFSNAGIDTVKITPTHVKLLAGENLLFTTVKKVIVGGEALTTEHVDILRGLNPMVRIFNEYGPTEATVGCICTEVGQSAASIGSPIQNTQIYLLDKYRNILPRWCTGEIAIGGECLALGYLKDDQLTDTKFAIHPQAKNSRLYFTGDIARWNLRNELEYCGRVDGQLKIRGYRIELSEIESTIKGMPLVDDVIMTSRQNNDRELFIVCYYMSKNQLEPSDFRTYLEKRLPSHMIPSYFHRIDKVPLTASGKLDYKSLPDPLQLHQKSKRNVVAPANQIESMLVHIWEEILEVPSVSCDDNFFEIGGHSLKATQMVSRIEKDLNVKVSLNTVFDHPTIVGIATEVSRLKRQKSADISKIKTEPFYELSHAQRRLWMFEQLDGQKVTNIIPKAFYLKGVLDVAAIEKALTVLIARHEILRTVFVLHDALPYQKVLDNLSTFSLKITDLCGQQGTDRIVKEMLLRNQSERFDLETGPLMRAHLVKLETEKYLFLFAMHHIISDGWSLEILIREVIIIYNMLRDGQEQTLKPLRIQYKDFTYWQNKRSDDKALSEYWRLQLESPLPKPELPLDATKSEGVGFTTAFVHENINEDFTAKINSLCRNEQVSLFMLMIAAIDVLLYRHLSNTDIILGAPNAGRNHPDLEHQIGYYLNILPLRSRFQETDSFHSLLKQVRKVTLGAFEHQDYSLARILDDLRAEKKFTHPEIFSTGLSMQNYKSKNITTRNTMKDLVIEELKDYHADTLHTLWFYCTENETTLSLSIQYDSNVLIEQTVVGLCNDLTKIISVVCDNPFITISEAAALSRTNEVVNPSNQQIFENINEEF